MTIQSIQIKFWTYKSVGIAMDVIFCVKTIAHCDEKYSKSAEINDRKKLEKTSVEKLLV